MASGQKGGKGEKNGKKDDRRSGKGRAPEVVVAKRVSVSEVVIEKLAAARIVKVSTIDMDKRCEASAATYRVEIEGREPIAATRLSEARGIARNPPPLPEPVAVEGDVPVETGIAA